MSLRTKMCSERNKKMCSFLMEVLRCNSSQTGLRSLKCKLLGVSLKCEKNEKIVVINKRLSICRNS